MRKVLLVGLVVLVGFSSSAQSADPKAGAKLTYDDHLAPLLRDKCFACHNQDRKSGGLRLNTFTNLMTGGASGPSIKPGDPERSLLFKLVTHQAEPHMPPKSDKLPTDQLALIENWIRGGALENAGSKAVMVNKPKFEIALGAATKGKPAGPPPMPQKLSLEPVASTARGNAVTALASSPWAPVIAVGGQKQVLLYHSDSLDLLGVLPFPEGVPTVVKFSRNGSLLLAGGGIAGKSGKVVVWSVATGERIFAVGDEMDAVLAADISSDQSQIALGGPSKVVRIYSTKDGKLLHEIRKHTDWIYSLEFSPDGVLLASGDRNGGMFIWEAYTGREYFSLRGHTAAINGVSWRADSNVLASASEDTTIRLWEMENGSQIRSWGAHGAGAQSVNFAKDGRMVSTGRDRVTKIWDGNGAQQKAFEALPDLGLRAVFSHDAQRVFTGDWTGQVRVGNAADGKTLAALPSNPPTLAQRLAQANQALAARQTAADQALAAAAASTTAVQKANAELALAQKTATDVTAANKAILEGVAKAKEAADKANAAMAVVQQQLTAREVLAKAFGEAAAKVKDAADKQKDNKELLAAQARSQDVASLAASDLATTQKLAADLTASAKNATAQLATAQAAATQATAAITAANTLVQTKSAAATAATTQAAAAKATADQASAALASAKAELDKVKTALASAKPVGK